MGQRIRATRERVGLSIEQAADRADRLPNWVVDFETGRAFPGSADLIRLADALGVSVLDFLPGEPREAERIYPGWEEREARWREEHPE